MYRNENSRKSSIVTTVVVFLVCLVLVTGSTFSLFTSSSKVNIAVTSGSVDVDAIIDTNTLKLWSLGETEPTSGGSFANSGSSAYINEEGTLVFKNILPGDNAAVTVDVTNNSNVDIVYRLVLTISGPLAEALDIDITTPAGEFNYGYTNWIPVAAGVEIGDIDVRISFPADAGNEYQGLDCSINFVLEAIQGNADVVDPITYNETTGVYEVNSEEGMMLMNNIINSVSHGEGRSLKFALTADMDMTGYEWTPVRLHWVDVDGQGHTVSNLNCGTDDWGRSGFAGYVGGGNISNLTLENVTAVGTQVGVVAGSFDGGSVSNVTIKGTNSVKYDYAINPEETWGGAGAIAGVASYLSSNSSVVIADGATISVNYNGLVTEAPIQDEYSFNQNIAGLVTNNGAVTTTGTPIIIEAGLGFIYGDNGEKTLYTITDDYTSATLVVPEGTTALRNKYLNGNTTITEVVIPASMTNFGGTPNAAGTGASGGFFYGSAVEKVTLPEGMTEIPVAAFNQAANLKEVNIPSTVTTIGINAFAGSGLSKLTVPATVQNIGYGAFRDMANLTTVTIEGNVNIPVYAFRACANLRTVVLTGDDVTFGSGTRGMIFTNKSNGDGSAITVYVANETVKERLLAADTAAKDYGGYTIVVSSIASNNAELDDAIKAGETTIVLGSGNYIIPDSAQGKTLTIVGNGDTVIATQDDGSYEGCDYSLDGATVTFENVVITTDSHTYTGYARLKATYNNCVINGTFTLYDNSTFNNCTFNVSGDVYSIWTWGASNATFNNCTFNTSGKAILLYGGTNTVLTVTDCTFNDDNAYADVNNKAAIEVGSDWTTDTKTIIATNCTVNGFDITTKGDNTGSTLWGDKNSLFSKGRLSVTVDGAVYVASASGLSEAINNGATKVLLFNGEYDLKGIQKDGLTLIGVGDNVKMANTTQYASGKAIGAIWQAINLENMTITNTVYTMADGGKSTFTNVYFADGFRQGYGTGVVFTDCTFGSNSEGYALHFQTDSASEGGLITLDGCKFEGGKVHLGGKRAYAFTNCDFAAGTDFQVWSNITLEGCTVDGVAVTADNVATLFPNLNLEKVTLK